MYTRLLLLLAALSVVFGAGCRTTSDSPSNVKQTVPPPPAASPTITPDPTVNTKYVETGDGLKQQINDLLASLRDNEPGKSLAYINNLKLDGSEEYFGMVFGERSGRNISAKYVERLATLEAPLTTELRKCVVNGQSEITVQRFAADEDQTNATPRQKAALRAMKTPVPLYTVKLTKPGEKLGFALWSFIYDRGAFRLVGNLDPIGG